MIDKQSYKILKFIAKHNSVTEEQLKDKFPKTNIYAFLDSLIQNQYIKGNSVPYTTTNFFTKETKENYHTIGPYKVTPAGLRCLQERKRQKQQPIITIFVTIATNLIITALKWLFPPLIQWLSNILEKTFS